MSIDPTFGWHEIAEYTITLQSLESSCVTLTTDHVLASENSIAHPSAIGFRVRISLDHQPFQHELIAGFYGDLDELIVELREIEAGTRQNVVMNLENLFEVRISTPTPKSTVVVEGTINSIRNRVLSQQPTEKETLTPYENSTYSVQFAFLMSAGDPPHLRRFILGLRELQAHLKLYDE